jgi:hypothetical protein
MSGWINQLFLIAGPVRKINLAFSRHWMRKSGQERGKLPLDLAMGRREKLSQGEKRRNVVASKLSRLQFACP